MDAVTRPLVVSAASRPHPAELVSGDAWIVLWCSVTCRIVVVDGAGHGPEARDAATHALSVVEATDTLSPAETIRACHVALHGSRGAAILAVTIHPRAGTIVFCGAGNVEGRLRTAARQSHLAASRGIVGRYLPSLREETLLLPAGAPWVLALHTDGVSSRFTLGEASVRDPEALAQHIVRSFGRQTDDATVVVVAPRLG